MCDEQASTIRALLYSGQITEIGGRPSAAPVRDSSSTKRRPARVKTDIRNRPSTAGLIAAFAAVYLIWGSTYLGIRYAILNIPPLLMMGIRHLVAGATLYSWARWRGVAAPQLREWRHPALIGVLLFLGGHGSLAWAELHVPSGIAALLVGTLPMWIVVLARLWGTEGKLSGRSLTGLALGFAGVFVLFGPDAWRHTGDLNLAGIGAILLGTFIWAAGTIYMRNVKMPDSPALASSMQMLSGGAALLTVAVISGETRHFELAAVTRT